METHCNGVATNREYVQKRIATVWQQINRTHTTRKPLLHHANAINIRPKHKKEASNFRFGSCLPPNVSFFSCVHSLSVAQNLQTCRSVLPFLSALTYYFVGYYMPKDLVFQLFTHCKNTHQTT